MPATTFLPESSQPVTETVYIPFSSSTEKEFSPAPRFFSVITELESLKHFLSFPVTAYVKEKSEKMNGSAINLIESYSEQEDEYTRTKESWDEEYYRMLLVWYRDNYAAERLSNIKKVGKEVYKNKPTLGKSKRQNRLTTQTESPVISEETPFSKKAPIVMATGNDIRQSRLTIGEWFKQNWQWVALIAGGVAAVTAIICLLSHR